MQNYFNPVKVLNSNCWFEDLKSCIQKLKINNPIVVTSLGRKKDLDLEQKFQKIRYNGYLVPKFIN